MSGIILQKISFKQLKDINMKGKIGNFQKDSILEFLYAFGEEKDFVNTKSNNYLIKYFSLKNITV